MSVTYLNPEGNHLPRGMYSHVALADPGQFAFVSGQVALDNDGAVVGIDDVGAQFTQAFTNLVATIAGVGGGPGDIVELKTYLVGRENLPGLGAAREALFAEHYPGGSYPTSTLVIISGLVSPELLVEVSAIARIPD